LVTVIFVIVLVGGALAAIVLVRLQFSSKIGPKTEPPLSLLTLTISPSTTTEGSNTTLSGALFGIKENKTSGLKNEKVTFHFGHSETSKITDSITTDSYGNYSYSWLESQSLSPGCYEVNASWSGRGGYPAAAVTATLQVIPKCEDGEGVFLVVDPSSSSSFNFQNGTDMDFNFNFGSSTSWYFEKEEDFWYPGLEYVGSYGFGPDC
jgi:hypothetical protein